MVTGLGGYWTGGLLHRGLLDRGLLGRGSPGRRLVAIVSAWPVTSCGNIQGEN